MHWQIEYGFTNFQAIGVKAPAHKTTAGQNNTDAPPAADAVQVHPKLPGGGQDRRADRKPAALAGGGEDDEGIGGHGRSRGKPGGEIARFGGAGLIGYEDGSGSDFSGSPANFYTALNSDFVLPAGGFIPGELYTNMQTNIRR